MNSNLKKTPLYEIHGELSARFVEFAGYEMPIQYSSIIEEHIAVRERAGIFDVSHMAPMRVYGKGALNMLQYLTSNNLDVEEGKARYTLVMNEKGGVKDDIIVYREDEERFLIVVNASNAEKIKNYFFENLPDGVRLDYLRDKLCIIAVQGPSAVEISKKVFKEDVGEIKKWHFRKIKDGNEEMVVARTGYTGEDGIEVICNPSFASLLFKKFVKEPGVKPCGLGARDSLRLEKALPLYGHELKEDRTPIESSLKRFVYMEKDFLGKEILEKQIEEGPSYRIMGIEMVERAIPRENFMVKTPAGDGNITSGGYSPILKKGIALAFLPSNLSKGNPVDVIIRGKPKPAKVVKTPFL